MFLGKYNAVCLVFRMDYLGNLLGKNLILFMMIVIGNVRYGTLVTGDFYHGIILEEFKYTVILDKNFRVSK